jgi:hypothetical protein
LRKVPTGNWSFFNSRSCLMSVEVSLKDPSFRLKLRLSSEVSGAEDWSSSEVLCTAESEKRRRRE